MVNQENMKVPRPSQLVREMFGAWGESENLYRKGEQRSVTVGGVTVTHRGLNEDPLIEIKDTIKKQLRK